MTAFDPRTLGIEKSEFDAAITANPALLEQFPEAREYAEKLKAASAEVDGAGRVFQEWVEEAETSTEEAPPFVLEFALSRGGEILSISSLASEAPEGIPEWAWQAYLEGLVVSARGRAALRVVEEEGRVAGLFADDDADGPWEDELFDATHYEDAGDDDPLGDEPDYDAAPYE